MSRSAIGGLVYALVVLAATVKTDAYIGNILMQAATYAIAVFGLSIVLGLCGQINQDASILVRNSNIVESTLRKRFLTQSDSDSRSHAHSVPNDTRFLPKGCAKVRHGMAWGSR